MKVLSFLVGVVAIASLSLAPAVFAQPAFPAKSIELVVPYPPGGGTDHIGRAFAETANKSLPVPMIVVNKPGATGTIGMTYVATGPRDGYRVLLTGTDILAVPYLNISKLGPKDLMPIARLSADPSTLTVRADSPFKTMEDFVSYAKANPGALRVSDAGKGGAPYLAASFFADKAGLEFTHVPYLGSAPGILGLLSGQVEATAVAYSELKPYVDTGKLRTIVVLGDKRIPGLDVPTAKERGIDASMVVWRGLYVAKGTPPELVDMLSKLAEKVAQSSTFIEALTKQNLTPAFQNSKDLASYTAAQSEEFAKQLPKLNLGQQ